MPSYKMDVRSLDVIPGNRDHIQIDVDIVGFDDEEEIVILLEDDVVVGRAEALWMIDSRDADAVRKAATELGLL